MREGIGRLIVACATPVLLAVLAAVAPARVRPMDTPDDAAFFESKVRPILFEHCFSCHGPDKQMAGLRLDSRRAVAQGAKSGPVIDGIHPEQSRLIRAIRYEGAVRMPPSGKLSDIEIGSLTEWVRRGAPWPDATNTASPASAGKSAFVITDTQRNFWSFRPVRRPSLPPVKNPAWCRNPIDRFVLADLEAKGLAPAPQADRRTLIRRATFDLTGLPPTPAELDAFLNDRNANAFEKVIERLLASPRYGERWGRHWLDIVRYCDSTDSRGLGSEGDISEAWRYRDWVIDAFNRDMPYTDFIVNQVAGDVAPELSSRLSAVTGQTAPDTGHRTPSRDGIIATGMLAIGNWGNGDADKDKILTDIADDQVDVVSRGFLALTIGCARCHNHKFDPISTKDYYGLAGIFFSTHILPKLTPKGQGEVMLRIPLDTPEEAAARRKYAEDLDAAQKRYDEGFASASMALAKELLPETKRYVLAAWEYGSRPASQARLTVDQWAAQQGLKPFAVRQWRDYLGLGDYRTMKTAVADVLGNKGVYAWRGDPDTPSAIVNTNSEPRTILTFTLPPRSLSVHPGPTNGVVVSWRCPTSGAFRVSGMVTDADPACGDGIGWEIDLRRGSTSRILASGGFDNGGKQSFEAGTAAEKLSSIAINAGERIDLLVLPKASHACDTTVVDLKITSTAGKTWDVTHDVLDDFTKSNPHADSFGDPDVWEFSDMADARRSPAIAAPGLAHLVATMSSTGVEGRAALEAAAGEAAVSFSDVGPASPFRIRDSGDITDLPSGARASLAQLAAQVDSLKKAPPPPIQYANGAQEGGVPESPQAGVHDVRVHIRGRYDRLAEIVPRRFPVVLAGENQPPITQGSGRFELARWIASEKNPLTARVIVNRVWQNHFGQGIVRTPSNFGFLGERPTNPALLDWLAAEFERPSLASQSRTGFPWSLKRLHRLIMLSATYQQSSVPRPQTLAVDPDNRLFGRMNRRRLEAEEMRDSLLQTAARLDLKMGGPAERNFATPRRTVYIITIRSDRSGFGPLFDMSDSTGQVDRRTASTVAPQALFLMNNPFVMAQAKELARALIAAAPDDSARIRAVYVRLYCRPPQPEEVRIGLAFLAKARRAPSGRVAGPGAPDPMLEAWTQYAQVLLCANEFMYVD